MHRAAAQRRSRVFQAFPIDFCCQGGRTLRETCERKGLAAASVVEELEAELADKSAPAQKPAELPPHELANYIFQTHHQFLWCEMLRLHAMAERVKRMFFMVRRNCCLESPLILVVD